MNHILKKTIQCLLSIFCVFGIMNTPVNTVKADGGFIYQSNGWSVSNDEYSFPSGWSIASNINEEGTYFFGYSSSENDSLETTYLDAISDSDISLINSNNDYKSSAITVYSNYLMLKTDNLSVGEYTLTIKDSSLKVTVEKTYAVLKDTDDNEYTLGQNNLINLKMGNKYTLTEVYKQTVNGKTNYTISDVTDNGNHYIDITNENGSYIIEPKEGNAGVNANFKIDTQEEFSLWPSYKIKENISSYVGTIQINNDNSFAIKFDDKKTLNSIQMNSNLYLIFDDENTDPKSFKLRNCVKSDSDLTLEGDSNVFRRGGSNVTKGEYSVYLSQEQLNNGEWEQVNWYLKAFGGNEKVQLTHNINKEVPEGLSYSLTQEEGFKLTCTENEACSVYLDTFYDTCMDSKLPAQTMYSTSVIYGYGYKNGGWVPFFAPGSPKNQIFEKKQNEAGKTIALTVPFDDFVYGNTNFEVNVEYPVTVHVLGYADYNFRDNLKYEQEIPNALPDGVTFDVKWDKENQKVIYITNSKEVFADSNLVKFSISTTTTTTGENRLTDQKLKESEHEVTYSNGLYYLTFTNDIVSGLRYSGTASITLVHREYGKVKAEHTITLEDAPELLDLPKDLNVQIIGAGIVITTSDTQYIDKAIGNLKIKLCSQLIASPERYQLDDAKYPLKKINNNQVKLYIKEDELKALKNDGLDSSFKFNINRAYYVLLYSDYYLGFNITGSTSLFKQSLEPIILAASKDTVANTSASELQSTLSKLDETATKLQNVTVDDIETNNTDVSIVGNVAGAITKNYEKNNIKSDLNLLPDSDDNKETITVKTDISNLDTEEANELANKVGGEATTAIDVSISKEYTKDPSKNTEITELPYDSVLTFDLPGASEEETYVVVREHEESDGTTSYTLLDVTENEDGIGSVASSKFSKFALVKQTTIEMVESPKSSTTEGSKTNLKFKTSGKANNVYLDNELVDPKNYESKDDGTVTLKEEYVSKLSAGKHTLKIITDKGMASSEFEITAKKTSTTTSKSTKTTNGWDDGGPFTTDTCGNVFDRWGNKIYEAKGCNVGGYNLVRTSVED